jgi:hypothetical protein
LITAPLGVVMDFGQSCALALNPNKAGMANANIIFIDKELIKVFLIGNKRITDM